MICKKCGAEIKDTLKFCNKCGAKVQVAGPSVTGQAEPHLQNSSNPKIEVPYHEVEARKQTVSNEINTKDAEVSRQRQLQDLKQIAGGLTDLVEGKPEEALLSAETAQSDKYKATAENSVKTDADNPHKSRILAGIIGFVLGPFGLHWFYLGKKIRGWLYLAVYLILLAIFQPLGYAFNYFCMFEGLLLLFLSEEKYNKYINLI